jgi:hypothetical protein
VLYTTEPPIKVKLLSKVKADGLTEALTTSSSNAALKTVFKKTSISPSEENTESTAGAVSSQPEKLISRLTFVASPAVTDIFVCCPFIHIHSVLIMNDIDHGPRRDSIVFHSKHIQLTLLGFNWTWTIWDFKRLERAGEHIKPLCMCPFGRTALLLDNRGFACQIYGPVLYAVPGTPPWVDDCFLTVS